MNGHEAKSVGELARKRMNQQKIIDFKLKNEKKKDFRLGKEEKDNKKKKFKNLPSLGDLENDKDLTIPPQPGRE